MDILSNWRKSTIYTNASFKFSYWRSTASLLLVSHMLTGCDVTSKIGTKVSAYTFVTLKFTRFRSSFNYYQYSRRSLSQTLKGPAKKFEIAKARDNRCSRYRMPVVQKFEIEKILKLRQKITKTNYEKDRSYYPSSTRHPFDVERLIHIKEKSKLIWTFIFFEIIVL